jgi:hypothetical protein
MRDEVGRGGDKGRGLAEDGFAGDAMSDQDGSAAGFGQRIDGHSVVRVVVEVGALSRRQLLLATALLVARLPDHAEVRKGAWRRQRDQERDKE